MMLGVSSTLSYNRSASFQGRDTTTVIEHPFSKPARLRSFGPTFRYAALKSRAIVSNARDRRFRYEGPHVRGRKACLQPRAVADKPCEKPCAKPNRRSALLVVGSLPLLALSGGEATALVSARPLADLPMRRLRLPKEAFGRDYVVIQMKIQGKGPFDFLVDSGLTGELITPHLQKALAIGAGNGTKVTGLTAGGSTSGGLLDLSGTSICCGEFFLPDGTKADELPLSKLHAFVAHFPQEHLDPEHDPIEGMLGMEVLSQFDVDFDFLAGRLRLWAPGTAASGGGAEAVGSYMAEVPAAVLNETGLVGIRLSSPSRQADQPMVGIIDTGASFSVVNWAGAALLGLPIRGDAKYKNAPTIFGVGVDGKPMPLPTQKVPLTFSGRELPREQTGGKLQFAPPPASWRPWDEVQMAVGDLPVFAQLLGDGKTPYKGPAALIGLDVLSQRRVILEAAAVSGKQSRRRRLFVS